VEADARRRAIWPVDEESRPPKDGGHVFLTLDATIQGYLDKAVRSAFETHKGKWATGIVIDPNTGTILAMCSYPNFDPNTFNTSSPDSRLCRAIAVPYEPGSAMKGVFAAAVVDAGLMTFDTKIDCMNGSYSAPNGGTVTDHGGPYGVMPLTDVVVHSKNVGMAKVGEKMGNPALYETARRFGFGQETGIELPGESCGIVRDLRKMDGYSLRRIPFGQEISVTGLQLAMAYGALVNGGTLYRPRLIDHITDATGNVQFQSKPTALRQVISPRTSQGILSVLQQVVERGTGKACQMDKWTSGGKTGTAQIAVGGVYPAGAFTSTFIGVAPASKQPALVCLISVYWPHSGHFGAQVAAPYVKEVLEQTLPYLNVPPDKTEPVVAGAGRAAP
jgi:cell division protein FtsI/penicillin-binding protein 2